MKVSISRNKREGYYAGYYRPCYDFDKKTKRRHRRWSWFAMNEFYPPIWGSVWKYVDQEGIWQAIGSKEKEKK